MNLVSVFELRNCAVVATGFQFSVNWKLAPYPTPAGGLSTPGPSIRQWIFDGLPLAVLLQEIVEGLDRQSVQSGVGFGRQDPQ
jgi:hypothetical protein